MVDRDNVTKTAQDKLGALENKLEKATGAMPKLSDANNTLLAKALPWAAGAWGVLSLIWAKDLWDGVRAYSVGTAEVSAFFNALASTLLPSKTNMWIGLVLFALVAVFIGFAFARGAIKSTRASWKFLFYAFLVSVIAGLFWIFMLGRVGSGHGWTSLAVGLAGLYSLFQVKSRFNS